MATSDTFQGRIGTVSPAFAQYYETIGINLDLGVSGVAGVTGANTLQPWKHVVGVTGIQGSNRVHSNHEY